MAYSQGDLSIADVGSMPEVEGWKGLLNFTFLASLVLTLFVAAALGAIIGFHPRTYSKIRVPGQLEPHNSFVVYAVVGAVVGVLVQRYGPFMGLVIFGLGGLMRFRSALDSPTKTGKAILVTLIGLCCGLGLPHVAVIATAFIYALIFFLERDEVYEIVVMGIEPEMLIEAAQSYRELFTELDCEILGEQKKFYRQEMIFVIRIPRFASRDKIEKEFSEIPDRLRGAVDWRRG